MHRSSYWIECQIIALKAHRRGSRRLGIVGGMKNILFGSLHDAMFPDRKSSADTKDPVRHGDEQ